MGRFPNRPFRVGSGTDLAEVLLIRFNIDIKPATVQRWLNDEGYPLEANWSYLVKLASGSKVRTSHTERGAVLLAAQPDGRYRDLSSNERVIRLLRETTSILEADSKGT